MIKRKLGKITKALAISVLALGVLCSQSFAFAVNVEDGAEVGEAVEAPADITEGKLTLYKYIQKDAINNEESGSPTATKPEIDENKKPVKGVAFKLIQTHSFVGNVKKDGPILGKFVALDQPVETILVTDADGKVEKPELPLGRYTLQEFTKEEYKKTEYATALTPNNPLHEIPAGLTPNTKEFTLEFPYAGDDKKAKDELTIYPKNQWISGQIGIQKWLVEGGDEDNKKPHKDVVYKLYTGEVIGEESYTYTEVTKSPLTGEDIGEIKTNAEGKVTITNLKAGETYFLLEETADRDGSIPRDLKMREVIATPSSDPLTLTEFKNDKLVKEVDFQDAGYAKTQTVEVEKEIDYRIKVMTPSTVDVLKSFVIEDKFADQVVDFVSFLPGEGTSAIKDFKVQIDGADKLDSFNLETITRADSNEIVGFKLTAKEPSALPKNKLITITAKAKVDQKITTETEHVQFPNDVKQTITYTDPKDPESEPKTDSEIDSAKVLILRGGIQIQKFDVEENNGEYSETTNFLNGAKFNLYKKEDYDKLQKNAKVYATLTTADKGIAKVKNLPVGKYVLVEIEFPKVPDTDETYGGRSYVAVNEVTEVDVLPYQGDQGVNPYENFEQPRPSVQFLNGETTENYALSSIPNTKPHWWLPFTGGNGVRMFTIGGVLLMTLSVGFAIAGKRRKEEAEA